MTDEVRAKIREVLAAHAKLAVDASTIADDADLFQAGITSYACVDVMRALEDTLHIEFSDAMLKRSVFQSIDALAAAISQTE